MTTTITPEEINGLRCLADESGGILWRRWADALADKIEAMQAENSALKQRIEESARTHEWDKNDDGYELEQYQIEVLEDGCFVYVYLEDGDTDFDSDFPTLWEAFEYCESCLRQLDVIRPIDTIIRPEGM
jgi:hypothetical protein